LVSKDRAPPDVYTLSLHDALPISRGDVTGEVPGASSRPDGSPSPWEDRQVGRSAAEVTASVADEAMAQRLLGWLVPDGDPLVARSEEHTSELQSRENLVCRLLLEK